MVDREQAKEINPLDIIGEIFKNVPKVRKLRLDKADELLVVEEEIRPTPMQGPDLRARVLKARWQVLLLPGLDNDFWNFHFSGHTEGTCHGPN